MIRLAFGVLLAALAWLAQPAVLAAGSSFTLVHSGNAFGQIHPCPT
jgi:hypothetical protein